MNIKPWRRVPGKALLFLLNVFSAVALIFEGYNQGVLGTVSGTPGFIAMANIGHNDVVTDSTKQGGLAAAYYFGAMIGCLVGGTFHPTVTSCSLADRYRLDGRQNWAQERRGYRSGVLFARLCPDERKCQFGYGMHATVMLWRQH
jgi:hypothetical protein